MSKFITPGMSLVRKSPEMSKDVRQVWVGSRVDEIIEKTNNERVPMIAILEVAASLVSYGLRCPTLDLSKKMQVTDMLMDVLDGDALLHDKKLN